LNVNKNAVVPDPITLVDIATNVSILFWTSIQEFGFPDGRTGISLPAPRYSAVPEDIPTVLIFN